MDSGSIAIIGPVCRTCRKVCMEIVSMVFFGVAIPALAEAVKLSKTKLEVIHTQALADRDYLTATLTQFRLDLDHGVEEHLLVKSLW